MILINNNVSDTDLAFVDVSGKIKAVDINGNPATGVFDYLQAILNKNTNQLFLSLIFRNDAGLPQGNIPNKVFFDFSGIGSGNTFGVHSKTTYFTGAGCMSLRYLQNATYNTMSHSAPVWNQRLVYNMDGEISDTLCSCQISTVIQLQPESIN